MAPGQITVTIQDEGYFKKSYSLRVTTGISELLRVYRANLCVECSNPEMLEFWYEATKVCCPYVILPPTERSQSKLEGDEEVTPKMLEVQDGDIIDVRVTEQCTRGACPIPAAQTLPNIHYLVDAGVAAEAGIQELDAVPEGPKRIKI